MYPIINIFDRTIGTYALSSLTGLIVVTWFATKKCKKFGLRFENIILILLSVLVGLIIGGHFLYGLIYFDKILELLRNWNNLAVRDIMLGLSVFFGGSIFYGGLIGAYIAFKIYTGHSKGQLKSELPDVFAMCIPLFHIFGRIGCFLGGCCYGIESRFGFTAHNNTLIPAINGVRRFPVSLVESALNLLIFVILLILYNRGKQKNRLIFIYLLLYSVVRFALEFLRGDEIRGIWIGLSTSQWISIVMLLTSIVCLKALRCKQQKNMSS